MEVPKIVDVKLLLLIIVFALSLLPSYSEWTAEDESAYHNTVKHLSHCKDLHKVYERYKKARNNKMDFWEDAELLCAMRQCNPTKVDILVKAREKNVKEIEKSLERVLTLLERPRKQKAVFTSTRVESEDISNDIRELKTELEDVQDKMKLLWLYSH